MKIIILFLMLCCSLVANSQCGNDKAALYYANGMFNSKSSADDNLKELKKSYLQKYPEAKFDKYDVAYNTDENALLQLLQVFLQKTQDFGFWRWIAFLKASEGNTLEDFVFNQNLQEFYSEERARDKDLKYQIDQYKRDLNDGFRVVTVAHS